MCNKTLCKRGRAVGTEAIGYINVALFMGKLYKTIWRQDINVLKLKTFCDLLFFLRFLYRQFSDGAAVANQKTKSKFLKFLEE